LIEYYKVVDGSWLQERNPKMLQDDYVKFMRFAQWKIDKSGEGAIGLITNRNYLENITFPGMRESILHSFDEIFILDLHGDLLKRETLDDGSRDENVFDITKGVAIILALRKKHKDESPTVWYAEKKGNRESKYDFLGLHDLKNTNWIKLEPRSPNYILVPRENKYKTQYEKYSGLNELFPLNLGGVKTHRDHFVIDANKQSLLQRIRIFTDRTLDGEFVRASLSLKDTGNWKLSAARKSLQNLRAQDWIQTILYRPFDRQSVFFHDAVVDRSRRDVVRHMLVENVSLIAMRQVALDESYTHFFVSDCMVDNRAFTSTKGIIQQFPLYVYLDTEKPGLFTYKQVGQRVPNLAPKLFEALKSGFKKEQTPEQIFHYIYALLYSNAYRKKYAEFLKIDFPRVPFTKDYKLFSKLAEKGEELVNLHLLKSKKLVKPIAKCEGSGGLRVDKVTYDPEKARVHINPEKWFAGISPEVWEYHIGGYQVSEKWLKDRKGKGLSSEEVTHYTRVVTAIVETIAIQKSLDDLFAQVEASLLEVRL
jgi:predicted helicase